MPGWLVVFWVAVLVFGRGGRDPSPSPEERLAFFNGCFSPTPRAAAAAAVLLLLSLSPAHAARSAGCCAASRTRPGTIPRIGHRRCALGHSPLVVSRLLCLCLCDCRCRLSLSFGCFHLPATCQNVAPLEFVRRESDGGGGGIGYGDSTVLFVPVCLEAVAPDRLSELWHTCLSVNGRRVESWAQQQGAGRRVIRGAALRTGSLESVAPFDGSASPDASKLPGASKRQQMAGLGRPGPFICCKQPINRTWNRDVICALAGQGGVGWLLLRWGSGF